MNVGIKNEKPGTQEHLSTIQKRVRRCFCGNLFYTRRPNRKYCDDHLHLHSGGNVL